LSELFLANSKQSPTMQCTAVHTRPKVNTIVYKMPCYRMEDRAIPLKNFATFYVCLSQFTAASRGFHCDSNAFELNNSINRGKITVSIYCL